MVLPFFRPSCGVVLGLLVLLTASCGSQTVAPNDPSTAGGNGDPTVSTPQTNEEVESPAQSDTPPSAAPSAEQPDTAVADNLPTAGLAGVDCESPQTQTEMNQCAKAWFDQEDAKLNRVYNQLKPSLKANQQAQLTEAELAWIEFRDTNCDFEAAQYEGGSLQPTIYYSCLAQVTADRTAELQDPASTNVSYATADQQLNQVYQALKSDLSESGKSALTTAQLAWLDYRDSNCAYEGNTQDCLARLTLARTNQLEEQAAMRSL
ncbi:lysozyme inhibitor LprI family protein [Almyronema epifaneia]|uniref:Lysozyme inhibitor LprI family protein n=1 Tax=Almyronema epifaneia S1 TaxID=2991925 RepID=A0ABW6IG86_9CYAN